METTDKFEALLTLMDDMDVMMEDFQAMGGGLANREILLERVNVQRKRLLDIFDWPTPRILHLITALLGSLEERNEQDAFEVYNWGGAWLAKQLANGSIVIEQVQVVDPTQN